MTSGTSLAFRLELAADGIAKWQKLFPMGVTKFRADFPKNGLTFDRETLAAMVSNYQAEGKPERAVNYFHRGVSGAPGALEEKIAAGWIQDLELREDGLYALVKWTDRAAGYIQKDELRYLSPEFSMQSTSKATGQKQGPTLYGAALLNDPFLTELPRVAATEVPDMKNLKAMLKLAEDASDVDVEKAVADLQTKPAELSELQGALTKLTEQVQLVTKENEALKLAARKAEVAMFVDGLVKAGKVAPAIRENVLKLGESGGVESIKFFESSPAVVVPGQEIGVVGESTADKRRDAMKRLEDREAELVAKGMKSIDAFNKARIELREDAALVFGE